jgi:hypothetical protein
VSSSASALTLRNNRGGALRAESTSTIAIIAQVPQSTALLAGSESGQTAAAVAANLVDHSNPAPTGNFGGMGMLGLTDRISAIGTAGVAFGLRSTGVLGQADQGVGVQGIGESAGVEGASTRGNGVEGFTSAPDDPHSAGVFGIARGVSVGVRGEAVAGPGVTAHSIAGTGVEGRSDQAIGVIGEASAANAAGVSGRNDHALGVGINGFSKRGTAVRAESSQGTAIHAETGGGLAVEASTTSKSQPAVHASSFLTQAVVAISTSDSAPAVEVFGVRTGIFAQNLSAPDGDLRRGAAISGQTVSGRGISGVSYANGVAVHGHGLAVSGAWAGHFQGNVFIDGILLKQASLFSIDHPLDPEHRVLNHASVEAPEYKTFYDGVTTLNSRGRATVRLPRWFDALNGDLRYQLTPLGAPAPSLYVSEEVRKNAFVIAGGIPGQRVCWQVTGTRRDAWAHANPLRVEQRRQEARPRAAVTSPQELERLRAELEDTAAALRKDGAARERAIRSRFPAARPAALPVPDPPVTDNRVIKMAERALAAAERPAQGERPRRRERGRGDESGR